VYKNRYFEKRHNGHKYNNMNDLAWVGIIIGTIVGLLALCECCRVTRIFFIDRDIDAQKRKNTNSVPSHFMVRPPECVHMNALAAGSAYHPDPPEFQIQRAAGP